MEQTLHPAEHPVQPRSIRWRQILAAILLCSMFFISTAYGFIGNTLAEMGWTQEYIGLGHSLALAIPQLIAFMLLIGIAANRMTRVAMGIAAGWILLGLLLSLLGHLVAFPVVVSNLFSLIDSFIFIYVFSLLLRNNEIAESRRKWIILLPVGQLYGVLYICAGLAQKAVPEGFDFHYEHIFFFSSGFQWFIYIMRLLLWIAWFKLTHSEAFAPTYDDSPAPEGAYSPATKYMAMPIICAVLGVALSWTLYHFVNYLV